MNSFYDSPSYRRAAAERQAERLAQQQQAEAQREADLRAAADASARHRAKLEAETVTRRQEAEDRLEHELSADRVRLERQWRVDHPDRSADDFDRVAWPLLRATLLQERQAATVAEALRRAAGDPAYGRL